MDADDVALEMSKNPNMWTDGSREDFSSVDGFEVAGAGVYLPAAEVAFESSVWGFAGVKGGGFGGGAASRSRVNGRAPRASCLVAGGQEHLLQVWGAPGYSGVATSVRMARVVGRAREACTKVEWPQGWDACGSSVQMAVIRRTPQEVILRTERGHLGRAGLKVEARRFLGRGMEAWAPQRVRRRRWDPAGEGP